MKKKRNQIISVIVALGLAFSISIPSSATSVSKVEENKEDLEDSLAEVKDIIAGLENKKNDAEEYMKELDTNLAALSAKLTKVQNDLEKKQTELKKTQQDLDKAKETETKQYDDMKKRIKFLYENGNTAYLELLLEAENFADMLNKADYIKQVSEYDRNMLSEYQNNKKSIEAKELQIKQEYKQIETLKAESEKQKSSVEELISAKKSEMQEYKQQIQQSQEKAAAYESEIAEQEALIKQLEEAAAAERKRKEEAAKKAAAAAAEKSANGTTNKSTDASTDESTSTSSSGFVWPCPSSKTISSNFGYRVHPITGTNKMHNGIDISAPTGTVIVAASSGTVVAATYSSSMGNYVMIDHGNDLYTIYMHCSGFAISSGTTVKAGQTIAYVGSTGQSTGPHLHFSVRKGGSYVSPWNYVS